MYGHLAPEAGPARRRPSGARGRGRSPTPMLAGAGTGSEGALGSVQHGVGR